MTRHPSNNPREPLVLFRPCRYSDEELRYFLDHLGESPLVALHGVDLPVGVNRIPVEDVLGRVYQLEELKKHRHVEWAGLDAIRESIGRYFMWQEKALRIDAKTRRSKTDKGPIRHASMHEWDSQSVPHKSGTGADGHEVHTEILADGTRRTFDVDLLELENLPRHLDLPDDFLSARRGPAAPVVVDEMTHDADKGVFTCSICGQSQSYIKGKRPAESAARGRMARHFKNSANEKARHMVLWARYFRTS